MDTQLVIKDKGVKTFILVNTSECAHWTVPSDALISPFSSEKEADWLGIGEWYKDFLRLRIGEVFSDFDEMDTEGCYYVMRIM